MENFPLPGVLSLLDFSTGNVLCQGYVVTLPVQPREAVAAHQHGCLPLSPEALGLVGRVGIPGLGLARGSSGSGFSKFCFVKLSGCFTAHVPIPHILSWHQ